MPNQPKTPKRGVRIDEPLWQEAQRLAVVHGESVSDVIRRALIDYTKPVSTQSKGSK